MFGVAGTQRRRDAGAQGRRKTIKTTGPPELGKASLRLCVSATLRLHRMKNRFPRIRFVALSTASAAPRAESMSARKQPTRR